MELLLILLIDSIAPDTLFAESPGDTLSLTPTNVAVPISWLIAVGIVLIAAIALAVTARRSKRIAEKIASRLCESEIQYCRLVESMSDGVFVTGLDGVVTYVNKAFCKCFDSMPQDIIGNQLECLLGNKSFQQIEAALDDKVEPARTTFVVTLNPASKSEHLEVDLGFICRNNIPIAIRGVVRNISAGTALEKELAKARYLYQEAKQMAATDSVTGLYNHRYLQERFNEELKKARQYGGALSVLMIDIDGFKDYNDAFGHLAGDDALRIVSKLLITSVRSTDVVARYGGEEFVILLLEAEKAPATKVAENIRARIDAHSFPHQTQLPTSGLTVSIGVATYPTDGKTKKDLLYAADMACYQGKREGKNRVVKA